MHTKENNDLILPWMDFKIQSQIFSNTNLTCKFFKKLSHFNFTFMSLAFSTSNKYVFDIQNYMIGGSFVSMRAKW
jgi:hypothetical protein